MNNKSLVNMINTTTPYAWDDSLGVYEFLGKIVSKLNEVVAEVNLKLPDGFELAFYEKFREYTREEMQRIIDSGEFAAILDSMTIEFREKIISINEQLAEKVKQDSLGYVTLEMYGAIGDGVNDDTIAFTNALATGKPIFMTGTYRINGNNIITPLSDTLLISGNGNATILWNNAPDQNLFNIGDSVKNLILKDFKIRTVSSNGGVIFNIYAHTSTLFNGGVEKPYFENLDIYGGVDYVFKIRGDRHCDRLTAINCGFGYFKNFYYSENSESVAQLFESCSFFSSWENCIYFETKGLKDCFNVMNSSFSCYTNKQTLLKNTGQQIGYKMSFKNNRFEFYKDNVNTVFNLFDVESGDIVFENSFFRGIGNTTPTINIDCKETAFMIIRDCEFMELTVNCHEATSLAITSNGRFVTFENCKFYPNPVITYESHFTKKVRYIECDFPAIKGISFDAYEDSKYHKLASNKHFIYLDSMLKYTNLPQFLFVEKLTIRKPFSTAGSPGFSVVLTINDTPYTVTFNEAAGDEQTININNYITSFECSNKTSIFYVTLDSRAKFLNA